MTLLPFRRPFALKAASDFADIVKIPTVFCSEQKVCRKSELPSCGEGLGLCLMVNTVNPIYFSSAPLFLALFPTQLSSPNSCCPSFSTIPKPHSCLWIFPPFLFILSCSLLCGKVIITWCLSDGLSLIELSLICWWPHICIYKLWINKEGQPSSL